MSTTVSATGCAGALVDVTLTASEVAGPYLLVIEDAPSAMAYRQAVRNVFACLESVAGNSLRDFLGNVLDCLDHLGREDMTGSEGYLRLLASGRRVARDLGRMADAAETFSGELRLAGRTIPADEILKAVLEQVGADAATGRPGMCVLNAEEYLPAVVGDRDMLVHALTDLLRVVFRRALARRPIVSIDVERVGERLYLSLSAVPIAEADECSDLAISRIGAADASANWEVPDQSALDEAIAREVIALHGGVVSRRVSTDGSLIILVALPIVAEDGWAGGEKKAGAASLSELHGGAALAGQGDCIFDASRY
jgi:hypothetical protein